MAENKEVLKLGKEYKNLKLYFIKSFEDYIKLQLNNEDKNIIKMVQTIRLKMFDYLEPLMVIDMSDMINILLKKYREFGELYIFSYVENVFNDSLYKILIEKMVKKRFFPENTEENYLEILTRNNMLYFGIVKVEILKILFIKSILIKDTRNLDKENNNDFLYINTCNMFYQETVNISKKLIQYYYNDLRNTYSKSEYVINRCKELIIRNKALS